MKSPNNTHEIGSRLQKQFIGAVIAICVAPFLLNLLGVDFGSQGASFPWTEASSMTANEKIDAMFYGLKGAFTHSLLEWSAFCTAIFDLGVNSFITKPVSFEGLVDIMKTLTKYWFQIVELPQGRNGD